MTRKATLEVTAAQLRLINRALASAEAGERDPDDGYRQAVMDRTRSIVWEAFRRAGWSV